MSVNMLCGVDHHLWQVGRRDASILVLVAFHCLLRTGGIFSLRAEHVAIGLAGTGMIALPWSKGGARRGAQEMITVDDPVVGRALASLKQRRGGAGLPLAGAPAQFRALFEASCAEVGLRSLILKPCSLRGGWGDARHVRPWWRSARHPSRALGRRQDCQDIHR